jgi:hypothetical protein
MYSRVAAQRGDPGTPKSSFSMFDGVLSHLHPVGDDFVEFE